MTTARTTIQDFSTANVIYAGAVVTAWLVVDGAKTNIKSDLFAAISGSTKVQNPQTLDSYGKFKQPVYIEDSVILTVTGLKNTPDHDTGVVNLDLFQITSQDLDTPTYVIDVSNISDSVTFPVAVPELTTAIIYNDSDRPAFAISGSDPVTPPVAVFPTSGNDPKAGKVIPAKSTMSYDLDAGTKHVAAIQLIAGTGNLYISYGSGS